MTDAKWLVLRELLNQLAAAPTLVNMFKPLLAENRRSNRDQYLDHLVDDHPDVPMCAECDALGIGSTPLCDHLPACAACRLHVQIEQILAGL
jgi:hypothetical protein